MIFEVAMAKSVWNVLAIALILAMCTVWPALGKGFDANGEKDNGKSK